MVNFEAVGNGGLEQLRAAITACDINGVAIVHKEEIPSRGIFKLKMTCKDNAQAQAAIQAAKFSLVFFE